MSEKKKSEHSAQWWEDQRHAYIEKNDVMLGSHPDWEWIDPKAFYETIFPEGVLEEQGKMVDWYEPGGGRPNGIAIRFTNETYEATTKSGKKYEKRKVKRYTITDDLDMIEHLVSISLENNESVICAPVSYFGKARTAHNARFIHAFAVDLDGVGVVELKNLLKQIRNGRNPKLSRLAAIPQPTFLVNSGTGFHLYYVLDQPIPLVPRFIPFLQEFKEKLTDYVWRDTTSAFEDRQYQGIYQGFRMPGTTTKLNGETADSKREMKYETVAFCHYVGEGFDRKPFKCSVEYLLDFVGLKNGGKDLDLLLNLMNTGGRTPIEEAKRLWPDWYQERIVEEKEASGRWVNNRKMYDWWLGKIKDGATDKHRYWCLNALAAYADKCGVPYEELEEDALSLVPFLESLTVREDNHFTAAEALAAIGEYGNGVTHKLSIDRIVRRTAIPIQKNKRNGRKQEDHLKLARFARDLNYSDQNGWGNKNGAPTKRGEILAYAAEHPEASHSEIARVLGTSRTTVVKWLKEDRAEVASGLPCAKYVQSGVFAGEEAGGQASIEGIIGAITGYRSGK